MRAIFDNAGFVIPGEDVKVAGVKVGTIDVARRHRRTSRPPSCSRSTDPGYQDFRSDASCIVRPQTLIGERFVECTPTQARSAGERAAARARARSRRAPGEGQYLLPVENTTQTVDIDLINNIDARARARAAVDHPQRARHRRRRPRRATSTRSSGAPTRRCRRSTRCSRSSPRQNDVLAAARASTRTRSWRRWRASARTSAGAIRTRARSPRRPPSGATTLAGRHRDAAARSCDELRPTMVRLGALADEMTPVLHRPRRRRARHQPHRDRSSGPFSQAAIPAFDSLGEATKTGTPAVTRGAAGDRATCATLASAVRPVGATLREAARVLPATRGGIERLMDYIFYQVAAINGFDAFGHYLRAGADRQPVRDLRGRAGRRAARRTSARRELERRRSAAATGAPRDPVLQRTRGRARAGARRRSSVAERRPSSRAAARERGRAARPRRRPTRRAAPARDRRARRPAPTPAADAGAAPTPSRATDDRCSTTCSEATADEARGGGIAGNPVLIGAATVLVMLVAVFLSYNANQGLPFVPTYQLDGRGAERRQPRASATTSDRRLARRRRSTAITAAARRTTARRSPCSTSRSTRTSARCRATRR